MLIFHFDIVDVCREIGNPELYVESIGYNCQHERRPTAGGESPHHNSKVVHIEIAVRVVHDIGAVRGAP